MVEFARWEMRGQLSALWQRAFGDPPRVPRYFLFNGFSPQDCLVYRAGGRIAAAVYLLPAFVLCGGRRVRAHYIFAAATLPEFRGRGYMSSLMAYAAIAGADRGDRFSVVLPAEESLYGFYEKQGYSPFFSARFVTAERDRLDSVAVRTGAAGTVLPDFHRLNSLRGRLLAGCGGAVLWSDERFRLAAGMNTVYGDRLVCASSGGKWAYALCRPEGELCTVLETMADREMVPLLAAALLRRMPAQAYRFRLPANAGLFPGEGKTEPFGMIRLIDGELMENLPSDGPYLGMTMD